MDAVTSEALRMDAGLAHNPGSGGAAPFNVHTVIGAFRRRLWLFLIVALAVAGIVAFVTLTGPVLYTATSTVLIDQHKRDVLNLDVATGVPQQQLAATDSSAVDTEVEILKSRSLASKVVDQLHLVEDPDFNGALRPPSQLARLMRFFQGDEPAPTAASKAREYEGVVSAVLGGLKAKRVTTTYTIDLNYTAKSPYKAAAIANAFSQLYLTQALDAKFDESRNATAWLDGKLAQIRQDVGAADAAVQQYKIANNLLSAQGATLTEQEISNIDLQVAQANAQVAEADARLRTAQSQLASGSNGGDVGEALNNPVVQNLRAQHATQSAHLADLQTRYGDKFPEVMKAKQSLADTDTQIQNEITRVISNLKAQYAVAHMRAASLASSAGQTRGTLAGNNRALVRLSQLQRDDDAARALYDTFLTRFKETTAKEGIQHSDARVVTAAKPPTGRSAPNKLLDLALAIVLGTAAGVAAVLLTELLERGVSSVDDVERQLGLPGLGEIPTLASTLPNKFGRRAPRLDPVAYVVSKPLSRFAEAFRNLRASVLSSRTGEAVKVVAITSSLPGEGKTTTALCLARTMALSGSNVVIVDCDLRQRSINRALPSEPSVGLLEVLNGAASLDEALVVDRDTGAFVLPLAKSAFTPRDVFGSEAMHRLLAELRARFDVVLLDTAPVLAVADTRILCPQADVVLFLTRWRKTSRQAIIAALRGLSSGECFVAGVALTQVNVREQARSGEGAGHYYRAYSKYYAS